MLPKGFAGNAISLAVQPHEISALKRRGRNKRKLVFQEAVYGAGIVPQVFAQGVQPRAAFTVCGLKGGGAEHVDVAALVVVDCTVHLCKNFR